MLFLKSCRSREDENTSKEKQNQDCNKVYNTVERDLSTELNIKNQNFNESKHNGINNMTIIDSNFQLPVIVVPPKEDVAHLNIESEFDLPIIFESANEEKHYATENCLYSRDRENNNFKSYLNYCEKGDTIMVSKYDI